MLSNTILTAAAAAAILAFPSLGAAAPHVGRSASDLSLTAQLRLADTSIDYYKLLPNDKDFVYDFNNATTVANAKTFPALVGTGASLNIGKIDACNMVVVHLHPRAAELQAVISGHIYTESVPESGVLDSNGKQRVIKNELGPGQMTVFHQGAYHTQVNPNCEPAIIATAFASEDMGATIIANSAFALDNDIVSNMFGKAIAGEDIDKIRHALPQGVRTKVDSCLAKCGKKKRSV